MRREHRSRAGFTAIELMIVIAIAMLLAGMSAAGVLRALRAASVGRAVEAVREAAERARALAIAAAPTGDGARYGVVIAYDEIRRAAMVGVVRGRPGDGKASDVDRLLEPGAARWFSPGVQVHVGVDELGVAGTPGEIAWYYEPVTGLTCLRRDAGWSGTGACVGLKTPDLTDERGVRLHGAGATMTVPMLAPSTPDNPGLSLRTPGGQFRRSLSVVAAGTLLVGEF